MADTVTKSTTYTYTPLPATHPTAFRTLELLPGSSAAPLVGRIRNHVDDIASYEALSYVWGHDDPAQRKSISVDGGILHITPNLHKALKRLRLQNEPRILWVDSVCINQADNDEKSRQVSRMKLYYQYATKVLIYLGEEADGSAQIPGLVDKIYDKILAPFKEALPFASLDNLLPPSEEELQGMGIPVTDSVEWNALGRLFLRPWWGRCWVIQELVQAPVAEIICGDWTYDWDRFADVMRIADAYPKFSLDKHGENTTLEAVKKGERNFVNLHMLRTSVERREMRAMATILDGSQVPLTIRESIPRWSLVDLMERCRSSEATNPRDYVYAMMGMCAEEAAGKLQTVLPDYSESVSETFIRYARCMVNWGDGIKLLYSASSGRVVSDSLPSWVPNWTDRNPHERPLSPRFDGGINHYYRAGLDAQPFIKLSTIADHLIIRGVIVDTIADVGSVTYKEPVSGEFTVFQRDLDVVAASTGYLLRFLQQRQPGLSLEQRLDTIWRTLCCNTDSFTSSKAPSSLGLAFQSLLTWLPWWIDAQSERRRNPDPQLYMLMLREKFLTLVKETSPFIMPAAPLCLGRKVAVTENGLCAQVPGRAEVGDVVFLPLGSAVPFVLRMGLDGYELQGECYLHNMMDGEVLQKPGVQVEDITIV